MLPLHGIRESAFTSKTKKRVIFDLYAVKLLHGGGGVAFLKLLKADAKGPEWVRSPERSGNVKRRSL